MLNLLQIVYWMCDCQGVPCAVGRDTSVVIENGFGLDGSEIEPAKVYGLWGGSKPFHLVKLTVFELSQLYAFRCQRPREIGFLLCAV
jgi:hypothetical protein